MIFLNSSLAEMHCIWSWHSTAGFQQLHTGKKKTSNLWFYTKYLFSVLVVHEGESPTWANRNSPLNVTHKEVKQNITMLLQDCWLLMFSLKIYLSSQFAMSVGGFTLTFKAIVLLAKKMTDLSGFFENLERKQLTHKFCPNSENDIGVGVCLFFKHCILWLILQ